MDMCLCTVLRTGLESRLSATVAYGVHTGDESVSTTGLFICMYVGAWV